MATTREHLHELLDEIPDDQLGLARAALELLATRRGTAVQLQEGVVAVPPLLHPDDTYGIAASLADAAAPYRPLSEAPEDDEPVSADDLAAIREGREAYARGEWISDDALARKRGR